jgi:hypothetical protein
MDSINAIIALISSAKYAAFKTRVDAVCAKYRRHPDTIGHPGLNIHPPSVYTAIRAIGNYLAILYPIFPDWQ